MSDITWMDTTPVAPSEKYFDLGVYGRKITTSSPEAQAWFDRGLVWVYIFNHDEGNYCFRQAIAHDPSCAMAYWGLAYSLGPNYNKAWERFDRRDLVRCVERGHHAALKARELATNVTPVEHALINAINCRFEDAEAAADVKKLNVMNHKYADAMEAIYKDNKSDNDIATLYADAMMQLTPWKLWNLHTGKPEPQARTRQIQEVLDDALRDNETAWEHPGVLHLYIHFIEMSPQPELGIRAADCLRQLIPDGGHAHHMPTHLDAQVGDWRRSIASNQDATRADERFYREKGAMNFYTFYRLHNYHALIYASMFAGQKSTALDAVERLGSTLPEEVLRIESPPMADWLEHFIGVRAHVMIRFGMWQDIVDLPLPEDRQLYPFTIAIYHYAKGVAHAAMSNLKAAEEQRELFKKAAAVVPETRKAYMSTAKQILAIATKMLDGEIEYRYGQYDQAFASLRECISLDDSLPYNEPWPWMQPPRHAYAALLLEREQVEEAAAVYKADLGFDETLIRARRHPNNVWALRGYHECLVRMKKDAEAAVIEPALRLARAGADVPVEASCFCRLDTSNAPPLSDGVQVENGCCAKK
ncbi:unnamed protein product [Clonostachys byssicola]|uniref:TPR domain protein n=1 Tax=Clonostachys byssicola TaxID=160290 RepID=A0A9N9U8A3_9HYPO|nr:unnamed protein product [Clonostachys byssicola]